MVWSLKLYFYFDQFQLKYTFFSLYILKTRLVEIGTYILIDCYIELKLYIVDVYRCTEVYSYG